MSRLETLMYEHAGYSYPPDADAAERERCKREGAAQLAAAWIAAGADACRWLWDADQDADVSWMDESARDAFESGGFVMLECLMYGPGGDIVGSLCGVAVESEGDPYCKAIEAQLALEAGYPQEAG